MGLVDYECIDGVAPSLSQKETGRMKERSKYELSSSNGLVLRHTQGSAVTYHENVTFMEGQPKYGDDFVAWSLWEIKLHRKAD
ncbi:unnamed protein product [Clonostachys rhizophaga]|uniref:Uncharacterized protein n=1 Tax=Clonostachys rhizophaga TaxID=160324 RepID=A0A9N9VQ80_9HYPO|nr:unnamed protein product [Clonostachys rhizophaga]